MRYFNTGDGRTDHNLSRLDHLASPRHCDGTADHMQGWLVSVIQSIRMLPSAVGRHFEAIRFKIGNAHYQDSGERRAERRHSLVTDLHAMVDAAETDPRLSREAGFGPIDSSDRPTTAGERIAVLCRQL